jgi:hypothetical protein
LYTGAVSEHVVSDPSRRWRSGHRLVVVLLVIGCAVATAACGSSTKKPTVSSNPAYEFARCMRAHGAPNFPDPTTGAGGGEGFAINVGLSGQLTVDGIAFAGPAFQSASKTCDHYDDVFGAPPAVSESQKVGMLANAACIRTHGVPNFPDPTFHHGIGLKIGPGLNPASPAIERAAKACGHVGVPVPGVGVG